MIQAVIFDLDGTLVNTEELKAKSYAEAVREFSPAAVDEQAVIEAYKSLVGVSRRDMAMGLLDRFDLEAHVRARMDQAPDTFEHSEPWQYFVRARLDHYDKMVADPDLVRAHRWEYILELCREAKRATCKLALATMSKCAVAHRMLQILDIRDEFDFVAGGEDVERGKPDPEIYLMTAGALGVDPGKCLAVEDSPPGVLAAKNAGMWCVAVATPFTGKALRESGLVEDHWIVDAGAAVPDKVGELVSSRIDKDENGVKSCYRRPASGGGELPPFQVKD